MTSISNGNMVFFLMYVTSLPGLKSALVSNKYKPDELP